MALALVPSAAALLAALLRLLGVSAMMVMVMVMVIVVVAVDLVADATHFVQATFGAVPDEDFPTAEEFLLAEANGGVADAAALGVEFGGV